METILRGLDPRIALRGVLGSINSFSAERLRVKEEGLRQKFYRDQEFYWLTGFHDVLSEVLSEEDFIAGINEAELGPPPIWTPDRFQSHIPHYFALSRWNRAWVVGETGGVGFFADYSPIEIWSEIKTLPSAKDETIVVAAGIFIPLTTEDWKSKSTLTARLREARDNPTRMMTLSMDYSVGRNSLNPYWGGTEATHLGL